jgi:hypothetical protein
MPPTIGDRERIAKKQGESIFSFVFHQLFFRGRVGYDAQIVFLFDKQIIASELRLRAAAGPRPVIENQSQQEENCGGRSRQFRDVPRSFQRHQSHRKCFFDFAALEGQHGVLVRGCPVLFVAVDEGDISSGASVRLATAKVSKIFVLAVNGADAAVLLLEGDREEAAFGVSNQFFEFSVVHVFSGVVVGAIVDHPHGSCQEDSCDG